MDISVDTQKQYEMLFITFLTTIFLRHYRDILSDFCKLIYHFKGLSHGIKEFENENQR